MTTPLTITSLNQGAIYQDWALEAVEDTPVPAKASVIAHETSSVLQLVRSWIKSYGDQLAAAARFSAWHPN